MQVIESVQEMQQLSQRLRAEGRTIGLVPTMGYLHEGHLSLVDLAKRRTAVVVVSIFVNPTQFGPNEDFAKYPRDLARDLRLLEERHADLIFAPPQAEVYPPGHSTFVVEESYGTGLCGISRPQFFRGVCTVVAKLFHIVGPHLAVFGQKDAQQAAVIRKMVRDLHFPVEILVGPTVREPDGLAMSSRNSYLKDFQRRDAAQIYQALSKARDMVEAGVRNVDRIIAEVTHHLAQFRRLRVIYVVAVDKDTMEPQREVQPGRTLLAAAVWCDEIRLIDNLVL